MTETRTDRRYALILAIVSIAMVLRWGVSLWPYSGAGKPPMFGDYEAQRHWMEITVGLPVGEWYHNSSSNNLLYWGLDYPPLTAYHSWLCGKIAKKIVPELVQFETSRGIESEETKLFMRSSVMVSEWMVYLPALLLFFFFFYSKFSNKTSNPKQKEGEILKLIFVVLVNPCMIMIDHGHFQYNSVSLGFTIFAIYFLFLDWDFVGSIFFCLSLNFKQMSLYHALPFFFYLLAKSWRKTSWTLTFLHILKLGIAVLFSFGILFFPFFHARGIEGVAQVIHRMFPVGRGLFEDKVANFWCTLSVLPFLKLKQLFDAPTLFLMSLGMTLIGLLPSCLHLLKFPTEKNFLLSLFNASMSFFLFSFQVHEKTILLPLLPASLLAGFYLEELNWFSLVSLFSMFPLLSRDGQTIPYFAMFVLFLGIAFHFRDRNSSSFKRYLQGFSLVGMISIHFIQAFLIPPSKLPDLFVLMFTSFSFLHFFAFYIGGNIEQFRSPVKEKKQ